jgi:non-specific serine/threonine protein kinase
VDDVAVGLANAATISHALGKHVQAVRLFAAAEALRDHLGSGLRLPERAVYERTLDELRRTVGAQTFQTSREAGLAMSSDGAVSEALDALDHEEGSSTTSSDSKGLTPREQDVLRLLVAGHTDREIASALYISPRTAQGHVAHVFAKLGVSTRTAAVAVALQADLIADAAEPNNQARRPLPE